MSSVRRVLVRSQVYSVAGDGLEQSLKLSADYPNVFILCYPCDSSGEPLGDLTGVTGTVVYTVTSEVNPYVVDIEANGDMSAPVESSFKAPATECTATISGNANFTHYRIAAVQYTP